MAPERTWSGKRFLRVLAAAGPLVNQIPAVTAQSNTVPGSTPPALSDTRPEIILPQNKNISRELAIAKTHLTNNLALDMAVDWIESGPPYGMETQMSRIRDHVLTLDTPSKTIPQIQTIDELENLMQRIRDTVEVMRLRHERLTRAITRANRSGDVNDWRIAASNADNLEEALINLSNLKVQIQQEIAKLRPLQKQPFEEQGPDPRYPQQR